MSLTDRAKSLVRPLRGSRIGRTMADELLVAQSGRLASNPAIAEVLCRLSVYDMAHLGQRSPTVSALGDLFFALVDSLGVERFIEAGAKDGAACVRASGLRSVTDVVAFEANPYTHQQFATDLAVHGIRHEHKALSDHEGVVELLVRKDSTGRPKADGRASMLERIADDLGHEQVVVDTVTLDAYFADSPPQRTAIWMDVEGATSVVVRGAMRVLDETEVAIIEVEERAGWEGQEWLRRDVVREMGDRGFTPLARDRQSRYQFNIVFVREEHRSDASVQEAVRIWREQIRSLRRSAGDE